VGEHHRGDGPPRDVDVLKGVNMAVRRSALGEIRLDERLRGSGAQAHWELGLCLAIGRAGWRVVYDPTVAVDHYPAARLGGDPRDGHTPQALADDVHNETYALLRWLPRRRKLVAFAYGVLVGSRRAPGLLVALEGALTPGRRSVLARLMTAQRARLDALRSALGAHRAPADPTLPTVTIVAHEVGTQGGMERQLGELCRGLLERGHRVVVVARRCELPPHPLLRRVRVPVPARPFALAYPAFFVAGSLAVRRHREGLLHTTGAVVWNRADLSTVHFCHHGFRDADGGSRASRDGPGHRANAAASAWMSRLAERVCLRPTRTRQLVAVSHGVKRELEGLVRERRSEVVVIPNGVDPVRFAPDSRARADVRTRLGLSDDDLVALFVGGDWERKGLRWAIAGVAASAGWHLLVVGDGDELRYRAYARGSGLGNGLHFVGSRPDPARYYASADALLLPTAYEAFPLVALEAAAAGLPLLAGRVSGVEELIEDGENGWFVERDGADIGTRLDALGADRALRRAMGAAARDAGMAYTWDRVVDAYVKLYETLARAPGTATLPSA
jgi:glycosyltransferase involved in cell wall biosynthesis